MTIRLCALLWAADETGEALSAYEDKVLALVPDHAGRVVCRWRAIGPGDVDGPREVQVIEFRSRSDLDSFTADERRTALADERDRAIKRTEVFEVEAV